MRHTMEQPAESGAFKGPAKSDPLPVELNRKNKRDEKQRSAPKQCELRISRRALCRRALQENNQPEERWQGERRRHQAQHAVGITGAHHIIDEKEVQRCSQRSRCPDHGFLGELSIEQKRENHEDSSKSNVQSE